MHTVNQILDRFAAEHVPKLSPRSQLDYTRHIRTLRIHFGTLKATEISPKQYNDFLDTKTGRIARQRTYSVLKSAFSQAVKWKWLAVNPAPQGRRWEPMRPPRALSDLEYEQLRATFKPQYQNAMDLALITGRPIGELLALKWRDVTTTTVRFRSARKGSSRDVPITPRLRRVLDKCGDGSDPNRSVICSRRGLRYRPEGFRAIWQRKMTKRALAGKPRYTFHDIRAKALQMHSHSVPADIQSALDRGAESQEVEYKDWVNLRDPVARAEIAKDLAALANFGGGYLIFGRTDDGQSSANPPSSFEQFEAEQFNLIATRYLLPAFQCEVFSATPSDGGDVCIVVRVPSHQSVPICAKADGPQVKGQHQGIRMGKYYTRAPQPRSVPIETPEQWKDVIRRCVVYEREILLREIASVLGTTPRTAAQHGADPAGNRRSL